MIEHFDDSGFDRISRLALVQIIAEHHSRAEDLGKGVGFVLSCNVGSRAVDRFVDAGLTGVAETGGWQHPDTASEHGGGIGQNIA